MGCWRGPARHRRHRPATPGQWPGLFGRSLAARVHQDHLQRRVLEDAVEAARGPRSAHVSSAACTATDTPRASRQRAEGAAKERKAVSRRRSEGWGCEGCRRRSHPRRWRSGPATCCVVFVALVRPPGHRRWGLRGSSRRSSDGAVNVQADSHRPGPARPVRARRGPCLARPAR